MRGGGQRPRQLLRDLRGVPEPQEHRSLLRPGELFDRQLADYDRVLFGGTDPAALLHTLLGTGIAAEALAVVYMTFFYFVMAALAYALVFAPSPRAGIFLVTALSLNWALGAGFYFLLPALGPIYADAASFAELPTTRVSGLQDVLIRQRLEFLADPTAPGVHQGIGAFASLHTSIVFTAALAAHMMGLDRRLKVGLWSLFALTTLATIYLGWHYVLDDIAGIVIGVAALALASVLTGFKSARRVAAQAPGAARPRGTGAPRSTGPAGRVEPAARAVGRRDDEQRRRMTRVALRAKGATAVPARAEVASRWRALPEGARTMWALGGCILLALVLRAPYLSTPLGRDEGGLTYIANNWPGGDGSLYGAYWVDRPPLLIGLFKLAGLGGEAGVRALGAIFAVGLVIAIALLAQAVAGPRAEQRIAALLAAVLSGSVSIGANFTPGELLAVVPSTLSVLCLVLAHRSRQTRFVVAAGALAVGVCAGQAGPSSTPASPASSSSSPRPSPTGTCDFAGRSHTRRARPFRSSRCSSGWPRAGIRLGGFVYTLFGFRLELLHTLAGSDIPLRVRLTKLQEPTWESGLAVALVAALIGLVHLRHDRVLLVTFVAWAAAAIVGVLGGGSYFAHYLIELVPIGCVGAAIVIARARWPVGLAVIGVFVWLALPTAYEAAVDVSEQPLRRSEVAVAQYLREHARPGETDYVMYARPNVVYYAGLRHPYPYLWSLMVRAKPGAREQLVQHLGSPRRPTWLVQWHTLSGWELDTDGRMAAAIGRGYRLVATVCGRGIYVRDDRVPRPKLALGTCPY